MAMLNMSLERPAVSSPVSLGNFYDEEAASLARRLHFLDYRFVAERDNEISIGTRSSLSYYSRGRTLTARTHARTRYTILPVKSVTCQVHIQAYTRTPRQLRIALRIRTWRYVTFHLSIPCATRDSAALPQSR